MIPATNTRGHEIQHLTPSGWIAIAGPFPTRDQARAQMDAMPKEAGVELRIYESLAKRKSHG